MTDIKKPEKYHVMEDLIQHNDVLSNREVSRLAHNNCYDAWQAYHDAVEIETAKKYIDELRNNWITIKKHKAVIEKIAEEKPLAEISRETRAKFGIVSTWANDLDNELAKAISEYVKKEGKL